MVSTALKWITGGLEAFWGIPFIGGAIIFGLAWIPLGIMFVLHFITLLISAKERSSFYGSIVGIITSLIAWIPVVGMFMHMITAALLLFDAYRSRR